MEVFVKNNHKKKILKVNQHYFQTVFSNFSFENNTNYIFLQEQNTNYISLGLLEVTDSSFLKSITCLPFLNFKT